ncbi:hypothetical protein JHW43_004569 [Diplocarpon mali]|nr:hypothetical protein JHW43_004569 [Diplocarpon mali]
MRTIHTPPLRLLRALIGPAEEPLPGVRKTWGSDVTDPRRLPVATRGVPSVWGSWGTAEKQKEDRWAGSSWLRAQSWACYNRRQQLHQEMRTHDAVGQRAIISPRESTPLSGLQHARRTPIARPLFRSQPKAPSALPLTRDPSI